MKNELKQLKKKIIHNAKAGNIEELKKLLEEDDSGQDFQNLAYYYALENNRAKMVKFLIEKTSLNRNIKYSLRNAIIDGYVETTKVLIEAGADFERDDFLRAARYGHTEIVKLLIEGGADVHADNGQPFFWAAENGHAETVKLFIDAGFKNDVVLRVALRTAVRNGHTKTVKVLAEGGADFHSWNGYALRWATKDGNTEIVKILKNAGASI